MAATIQVILQHDVANVGVSGELVKVRPGYARNYLLPRQLALPATTAAVNRINHDKAVALARSEKLKKEARDLADKLSKVTVKLAQRVGEDGRLFGAVTPKDVEAAVKAQGFDVDRKKFTLHEAIRALGTYEIPVKLFADVTATLKVEVVAK
jgi:large subunit ribosomal protein L9